MFQLDCPFQQHSSVWVSPHMCAHMRAHMCVVAVGRIGNLDVVCCALVRLINGTGYFQCNVLLSLCIRVGVSNGGVVGVWADMWQVRFSVF